MKANKVGLVGVLAVLAPEDATRLAAYVVRGADILAQGSVDAEGKFRVDIARAAALRDSDYDLEVVIGPAGMSGHLSQVPQLIRVPLARGELERAEVTLRLAVDKLAISDAILSRE